MPRSGRCRDGGGSCQSSRSSDHNAVTDATALAYKLSQNANSVFDIQVGDTVVGSRHERQISAGFGRDWTPRRAEPG